MMRLSRRSVLSGSFASLATLASGAGPQAANPLPSWREGKAKSRILAFVDSVTHAGSPGFVPPAERIAVFDNDGTLWAEQPLYFQFLYAIARIKDLAPLHPEWATTEPFAAILRGDLKAALAGGEPAIFRLVSATHSGITTEEFDASVRAWLATARHPETRRAYTRMVYQPMIELLGFLRANGFKTWIVSGGGIDFVRAFAEPVYGIPPEQVIGSSLKTKFEMRDGNPALVKQPEIFFFDDGAGKPSAIQHHIGRRPIAAFGNSDGDLQMLQWTAAGPGERLAVFIHHTDGKREWNYDRASSIGKLDKGLNEAMSKDWPVVDMAADWQGIFP
jgi:phosphoglycolate phosphatase-like HAD superfamily hydrolase